MIDPKENIITKDGRAYTPDRFHSVAMWLTLSLVFLLLNSCNDPITIDENIIKIPAKNDTLNMNGIKPLKSGNIWKYLYKRYDNKGTLLISVIVVDSVLKDTLIDKSRWFITSMRDTAWQSNFSDGLRMSKIGSIPVIEWLEAKYPGTTGFTWQVEASQRNINNIDTTINVTAGTFRCYYYGDFTNTLKGWEYSNIFYTAKVGLIKRETFLEETAGVKYLSYSLELIDFTIK